MDGRTLVVHDGDVSYAEGFVYGWDVFMHMMGPIVHRAPYMLTPGVISQGRFIAWDATILLPCKQLTCKPSKLFVCKLQCSVYSIAGVLLTVASPALD